MQLNQVHIKNFKSLKDVQIDLGRVNVFIGPNGVGKTSILEAIGLISASMSYKFDDSFLAQRGVRLGTPYLYKYSSKKEKSSPIISLSITWKASNEYCYKFAVNAPQELKRDTWLIASESLTDITSNKRVFGRSNRSANFGAYKGFEISRDRSMYGVLRSFKAKELLSFDWEEDDILNQLEDYGIYAPNTLALRGIQIEDTPRSFILGLFGQRLADATSDLIRQLRTSDSKDADSFFKEFFRLNSWVYNISVGGANNSIISANVSKSKRVIRFKDKFMKDNRNILTAYDANEGALYSLFLFCLTLHKNAPNIFAIDNFDSGMNPRIAKESARLACDIIKNTDKTALLTTHNPLVLDGLDLADDRIRLFAVDRDRNGATFVERIVLSDSIKSSGVALSELWLTGRLGGMPNL